LPAIKQADAQPPHKPRTPKMQLRNTKRRPALFMIEASTGIGTDAKQEMMQEITTAIDEAFHIPTSGSGSAKYAADNVAQDGRLGDEPVWPLCGSDVLPEDSAISAGFQPVWRMSLIMRLGPVRL
jgi:hypothetical protein